MSVKAPKISGPDLMNDYMSLMDAGNETFDLALNSCVFRLKQNPEIYRKLMWELERCQIKEAVLKNTLSNELLAECDYLSNVIKESLRMDPPAMISNSYLTLEDAVVCNVKIPKDTIVYLNIAACHYNPEQWHDPKRFIPERFDPTSEYFTKPGTGNYFLLF